MKNLACAALLLFFSPLFGSGSDNTSEANPFSKSEERVRKVSFSDLSDSFCKKNIEIRGFIYVTEDGKAVLASQPNLKSCCVGRSTLSHGQIFLEGLKPPLPAKPQAVTVQGVFHMYPQTGEKQLTDAKVIEHQRKWIPVFSLLGAVILCLFVYRQIR